MPQEELTTVDYVLGALGLVVVGIMYCLMFVVHLKHGALARWIIAMVTKTG
jgi:hypothetical protein